MVPKKRIGEIDFLRGIAIILMITFHLLYDLKEFCGWEFINYKKGPVFFIGKTSALMFITITAISCSLSRNNIKRGLKILFFALIITVVTYFYDPKNYINFGILHFLGISVLLFPFFNRFPSYLLAFLAILSIILGNLFADLNLSHNYLLAFRLTSSTYQSLDYYPLFPYLGAFLGGMILKRIFYPKNKSLVKINLENNFISFLGRHSLVIYLSHQPIFLLIIEILT